MCFVFVCVCERDIGNIFTISKFWLTPYSLQVHLALSNLMALLDTRRSVTSWLNNKGLSSHICIVRYPTHLLEQQSKLTCLTLHHVTEDSILTGETPYLALPHLRILHLSIFIWKELAHHTQKYFYIFVSSKHGKLGLRILEH